MPPRSRRMNQSETAATDALPQLVYPAAAAPAAVTADDDVAQTSSASHPVGDGDGHSVRRDRPRTTMSLTLQFSSMHERDSGTRAEVI